MMANAQAKPASIDEYIASFPQKIQAILETIRMTVKDAAPGAQETISYNMPAFTMGGVMVYFAAFKKHIGFYPPVKADAKLQKELAPYLGEKGSLRFPLDQPMPYALIEKLVKLRVKQMRSKKARAS
jgi:uncharacterized protein YdhG (YjbR/CyaY superfamily)